MARNIASAVSAYAILAGVIQAEDQPCYDPEEKNPFMKFCSPPFTNTVPTSLDRFAREIDLDFPS